MNIFASQSKQAMIELEEIADVQRQVITPALSLPIIGIVQDGLLGAYNLSQPSMKIDWKSAMNMMAYTTLDDFESFKKDKEYGGNELFSLIIPSRINTKKAGMVIENGNIKSGILNKGVLGSKKPQSLIHLIWDQYGHDETRKFIDNTQRLINNFNMWNGFSVGIGDIDIPKEVDDQLHIMFETKKLEVDHLITEIENNPDLVDPEVFEQSIQAELNTIRDNASKLVMAHLKPDNGFNVMITSGSKGADSNMGQMAACIGQQLVEGKRIRTRYNGRSLQYFFQGDDSAIGRGFVERPYVKGADPIGFIFHNMGSREGLIDTAIKSVTGDTPIVVLENGVTKRVLIGDWIDQMLDDPLNKDKVEHHDEREMELLNVESLNFKIPTTDEDGNVTWGEIKNITRHLPGKELYKIKTDSGREVIVTESKSLLIWEDGKFLKKDTPLVKVGDFVPVTINLPNDFELDKEYLDKMVLNNSNGTYREQNDVVLDPIVEIEKVDVKKYPKVYDLTIPSTLNFGLANGLHVVDTAESGYVQRKLIKSLEDLSVKYDGTVRTSNNHIIQFVYGDSGVETTRQSEHKLGLLEKGNKELADLIKFSSNELKNFKNFSAKDNETYYNRVLKLRDELRTSRMKALLDNITFNPSYMIPVNIINIINIYQGEKTKGDKLEPDYVIKRIDEIMDYENTRVIAMNLAEAGEKKGLKSQDEIAAKTVFQFSLYEYLSPKILLDQGINTGQFNKICDDIIVNFNRSLAEPGEMVGVVGAQSIGEPVTQLTLNSIDWNEYIIVSEDNKMIVKQIGDYIDEKVKLNKNVIRLEDNKEKEMGDTYYIDTTNENIMTISVNKDGKLSWNKVTALTKHLPINKDGTDDLVKITTRLGRTVTATKAKSFLTRIDNEIVAIRGDEIKIGMKVPIMIEFPNHPNDIDYLYPFNVKAENKDDIMLDIYLDDIVFLEIVKPSNKYVYDMTVENDKTFTTFNGILMMDTFHSAGMMSSANLGVPRIKELLSLSKNIKTPIMVITLDKQHRNNENIANKIASHLKHTRLRDIRTKIDIIYDPNPKKKGGFMDQDNVSNVFYTHTTSKNSCLNEVEGLPWLLRIELDREKMMEKDITLLDIKSKFCNNWEKRYNNVKGLGKDERELLERITQTSILSNSDNNKVPIIHIRFDMTDFNFSILINFVDTFVDNFQLKGVPHIAKIIGVNEEGMISFENENKEPKKEKQFVIYTDGVNLGDLRYINGIDLNSTICNDVMTVYEMFGIDAARTVLIKEIRKVFDQGGSRVNFAHLEILADLMTSTGQPVSIDRHGLNKLDVDPLARASFEKTVEQLINASVFGEVDHMKNVSSRIMAGQVIKGGTGLCELVLDSELLENSEYTEDIDQQYVKTYNEVSESSIVKDIIKKEVTGIFIPDN